MDYMVDLYVGSLPTYYLCYTDSLILKGKFHASRQRVLRCCWRLQLAPGAPEAMFRAFNWQDMPKEEWPVGPCKAWLMRDEIMLGQA